MNVSRSAQINIMKTRIIIFVHLAIRAALLAVILALQNAFHALFLSSSKLLQALVFQIVVSITFLMKVTLHNASVAIRLAWVAPDLLATSAVSAQVTCFWILLPTLVCSSVPMAFSMILQVTPAPSATQHVLLVEVQVLLLVFPALLLMFFSP